LAWFEYRPYVSAAQRRQSASRELARRKKKGLPVEPVTIEGRTIARSFWGKAWCDHLEGYSDYANRLPRGRTYVRSGSVLHLGVSPGRIEALVQGSSLYEVSVNVTPLPRPRWKAVVAACSGKVDSLVELLRGKLSGGVMRVVTDRDRGLFPAPSQIQMECSCPDWATMCKHVAAVLYGIGARLDERPELLFTLRKVDHLELLSAPSAPRTGRREDALTLAPGDLASVFGIEIESQSEKGVRRSRFRPTERAAAPAPEGRVRAYARGGSVASVAEIVDRIVDLLAENEQGLSAEQIRVALDLEAKALARPIAAAILARRVRKTGRTRATTYFAARPGKQGAAGNPKRSSART
jgi:uncharacterized Zn finger protein